MNTQPSADTLLVWLQGRWQALHGYGLVILASGWLAGIVFAAFWHIPHLLLLGMSLCAALLALFQWSHKNRRLLLITILCFCAGTWRYTLALPANDPQAIAHAIGPAIVNVQGTVSTEPTFSGRLRTLTVETSEISSSTAYNARWTTVHGTITVQTLGTTIDDIYGASYGDNVTLQGKLIVPTTHTTTDVQASMSFPRITVMSNTGNPLIAQLYHFRVRYATIITQVLPQPLAALLIAIVLGLRTPALKPLSLAFNVTGTAHLIVPSGFKVTITGGLIATSTRWLQEGRFLRRLPRWHADIGRWLQITLVIGGIAAYTVLSGAGAAALRAGIMGSLLVLAPRIGRTYNVYTALAFTALALSLLDPLILWDIGFQLSFLGTLGIVLFTPYLQQRLHVLARLPGGHFLVETSAVTLAAQLGTLPIFAITFQQISFIAPVANILTVPLLGILIILGLAISLIGIIALPLARYIGWIAWPLLWYTSHAITWCASLPYAYLAVQHVAPVLPWLYYLLLTIVTVIIYKRYTEHKSTQSVAPQQPPIHHKKAGPAQRIRRILYVGFALLLIGVTVLVSVRTQPAETTTISFLPVGPAGQPAQGEAILLHTADGATALIDGGPDATSLAQTMDNHFPPWQRTLDLALLTIPRSDHLTGLEDIITRYTVHMVVDAGMLHPNTTYARWRRTISEQNLYYASVSQGQTLLPASQVQIHVLWPPQHQWHKGSTEIVDNGMVLQLSAPGMHILLLGDVAQSRYALKGILQTVPLNELQATVVQIVGWQGQTPSSELTDVIQAAHPSLLVITPPIRHTRSALHATTVGSQNTKYATSLSLIRTNMKGIQTEQTGEFTITITPQSWTTSSG